MKRLQTKILKAALNITSLLLAVSLLAVMTGCEKIENENTDFFRVRFYYAFDEKISLYPKEIGHTISFDIGKQTPDILRVFIVHENCKIASI